MERKPLPEDLREMLDRHKVQTQKELRETLKRLTPKQLKHVRSLVSDRFARKAVSVQDHHRWPGDHHEIGSATNSALYIGLLTYSRIAI